MQRYYEYRDINGKRWGAMQSLLELPGRSVIPIIRGANMHLAINARAFGWDPHSIQTWHPDFPLSEVMKRNNDIQRENGNPLLHTDEDIAKIDHPGIEITIAQFDAQGKPLPSLVIPPLGRKQMLAAPTPTSDVAAQILQTTVIHDNGLNPNPEVGAGSLPPASGTVSPDVAAKILATPVSA